MMIRITIALLLALSAVAFAENPLPDVCYEDPPHQGFWMYPVDCYELKCAVWCPPYDG